MPDGVSGRAAPGRRLVQLYTGPGKGKTTAAVGQAVRALGRGWSVNLIQFCKPGEPSGEVLALRRLGRFEDRRFGARGFVPRGDPDPEDLRQAELGLEAASRAVRSGEWDMVVLDEIVQAVDLGLLSCGRVLDLVSAKPDSVELLLTGRNAPPEIRAAADLVSDIRDEKHPYRSGRGAREGIEY
jgi:cob(I)alamin adenosyltransferase